jgi:hypothetical protein
MGAFLTIIVLILFFIVIPAGDVAGYLKKNKKTESFFDPNKSKYQLRQKNKKLDTRFDDKPRSRSRGVNKEEGENAQIQSSPSNLR